MTKTGKIISVIIVILIIIGVIFSISKSPKTEEKAVNTEPIKIGFIGPLTGEVASLGVAGYAATQIAVDEINSSGGINGRPIQLIVEDGKCTNSTAVTAAQKLLSVDKVSAIIGGLCSSETTAFVKIASDLKIPVISYGSSAPALSQSGKYFFRTYPSDANQGKVAAEYLFNELEVKNVAVLYHISDWGSGIQSVFVSRFKELGGNITNEEGTLQTVRDYKTQLTKINKSKPDYIYMPTYPEGGLIAVKQIQDLGLKLKIFGADSWGDTKFIKEADPRADILYVSASNNPTEEFKSKLLTKIGGDQIPTGAPQAYDAVHVLAIAMKNVGLDGDVLSDALRKSDFNGVSGQIKFDQNGDITTASYWINRIKDGKSTRVE